MLARAVGTVAILGFLACPALQIQAGEAELAALDLEFAQKAAEGGLMEVQLGELAQQQAKDGQVVQFGERMVQDHGQANEKLMAIAGDRRRPILPPLFRSRVPSPRIQVVVTTHRLRAS